MGVEYNARGKQTPFVWRGRVLPGDEETFMAFHNGMIENIKQV